MLLDASRWSMMLIDSGIHFTCLRITVDDFPGHGEELNTPKRIIQLIQ